jgi:pyridoxal phosphate enzyme (YggS family)
MASTPPRPRAWSRSSRSRPLVSARGLRTRGREPCARSPLLSSADDWPAEEQPLTPDAVVSTLEAEIRTRLGQVCSRMAAAAVRAGRPVEDVRLIAVSKTFGLDHVRAAARAGQLEFGENRVQEALQKIGGSTDLLIRWHLVGHLQSNKARKAVGLFACIQSVDSYELLERLESTAVDLGAAPELLIQVDLASEPTKHGAATASVGTLLERACRCKAAHVVGLMALPPFFEDPERARPYFRQLRELRDRFLADGLEPAILRELSMGMSHDFEVAIEEGATMVRVGTAIFGARDA